ncbi:nuclear transport factor 2 family protein [Algoriphagus lutimaris]|uniref:nuclear transport factor 2 family protein n=1 Tax=Algoriphagus lutimaris TaxID=613197 RepID=UPI00196B4E05|nr:nuclear transport factor 2 family protein [Algoriphagus lutimaris]MBN3520094.1 nuclear transport factor 2 family protein [Algoriphagus lutimaris]
MKKLSLVLLFFGIGYSVLAQEKGLSDEVQIQNLVQESFDVLFSSYDLDQIDTFYTPDIKILENGEIWDMDIIKGLLTNAKSRNSGVRTNKFEFIETHVDHDMGYTIYHNYASFLKDGEVTREIHWIESVVAIKTENGWRIKNLHSFPASEKK